jgi:hypothetical protein
LPSWGAPAELEQAWTLNFRSASSAGLRVDRQSKDDSRKECPSNIKHSQAELYCQYCRSFGRGNTGSVTQRKNSDEQWRREEQDLPNPEHLPIELLRLIPKHTDRLCETKLRERSSEIRVAPGKVSAEKRYQLHAG